MSENRKIMRGAGLVGGLTAVSRVLGLLRDMVIAGVFGAGLATDAFFVALRVPNVLRRLFAEGALTVSFIPIFKEAQLKGGREKAREIADVVFTFLVLTLAVVVLLGVIFTPFIIRIIAPGFTEPDKYGLTVYLARIIFPYIFLVCMVALSMGILNSAGRFAAPAAAPIVLNVSMILAALFAAPMFDEPVVSLAVGVILGGILQVMLQVPSLKKEGYLPRLNTNFSHPALKKLFSLMAPGLFGIAVYQLNIFISTILASFLPEGSVSYLYYADRFFQLPLGVFVVSMATAVLPTMSEQVASGRLDSMRNSLSFSLRVVVFITLPAAAGLVAVSEPIFSLFFQRGEFDHTATVKTARALQFYALGLWAIGGVKIVVPAFYAMQDMKTPVWAAFAAFVANIILSLILMGPLLHGGLALATSLSSLFNLGILLFVIREKVGEIVDGSVMKSFFRALAGSVLTAVAAYCVCLLGNWEVDGINTEKVTVLLLAIAAGTMAYLLASLLMKSEEAEYIMNTLRGKATGR